MMHPVLAAAARAQAWHRHLAERSLAPDGAIPASSLSLARIKRLTADAFGVTVAELEGERRAAYIVRPRQVAMYLGRQLTNRSLSVIGRAFGSRDHTTVHHAARRIETLRPLDPELDDTIAGIEDQLREVAA